MCPDRRVVPSIQENVIFFILLLQNFLSISCKYLSIVLRNKITKIYFINFYYSFRIFIFDQKNGNFLAQV